MFERMHFSVVHHSSQLKSCYSLIDSIKDIPFLILSDISGTAAMMVGCNSDASPFEPFFILDDLSDNVKVDEYPIPTPK